MTQPRQSAKTGEVVAAAIRRRIANGELKVGDRLQSEEEMTESLGVARTTLREALRVLESQGLIAIKRGRGGGPIVTMPDLDRLAEPLTVVLQLRETTTTDLDAARALIEPNLAGWLATRHTDDDLAALSAAALAAEVAADADDRVAFGRAAALVHETLLLRSGNNTLSVISQLLHRIVLERYVHAAAESSTALMHRAAKSYAKLARLVAEGNADAARAHWEQQMGWMATAGTDMPLDILDAD
jgi:GntR family transcriptional regulator, transcriptional repressor for pyruvate dehydrogenase complex